MFSKCVTCDGRINRNAPALQCAFCPNSYHSNGRCCEVNREQADLFKSTPGMKWVCQPCRAADADGTGNNGAGDGDGGLGGGPAVGSVSESNIEKELRLLRQSVSFCSDKISDFQKTMDGFTDALKKMNALTLENQSLKTQINTLNTRIESMEQYQRANSLEIQGMPESKNENLVDVVKKIGDFIDFKIDENKIDCVHRILSRNPNLPKPIIVKFNSRIYKENVLGAAKIKIRSKTDRKGPGLFLDNSDKPIFINENLSSVKKFLYKNARDLAKTKGFKFVWTRNGNIFLRKNEQSKIILVEDSSVLDKLSQAA